MQASTLCTATPAPSTTWRRSMSQEQVGHTSRQGWECGVFLRNVQPGAGPAPPHLPSGHSQRKGQRKEPDRGGLRGFLQIFYQSVVLFSILSCYICQGSLPGDCCTMCCCASCAIIQLHKQVWARAYCHTGSLPPLQRWWEGA